MARTAKKIIWEPWQNPIRTLGRFEDEDGDGHGVFSGPVAVTRMGLVPVHDGNDPEKVFSLWVGHTNFTLTEPVSRMIAAEPGVESLDVLTRYRFRLGVAKAYQPEAVKKGVELALFRADRKGVRPVLHFLSTVPDYWALAVLPGGKTAFHRAPTREQAQFWLDLYGSQPVSTYVSWGALCHDD